MCDDFWFRRVRTIQLGDRDEQYVIDLLAFAGSKEKLIATQGEYGIQCDGMYDAIFEVLTPVLCSNEFLKVGQNLRIRLHGVLVELWKAYMEPVQH